MSNEYFFYSVRIVSIFLLNVKQIILSRIVFSYEVKLYYVDYSHMDGLRAEAVVFSFGLSKFL